MKEHDFALGDPVHAKPLPAPVVPRYDEPTTSSCSRTPTATSARTQVILSRRASSTARPSTYQIELDAARALGPARRRRRLARRRRAMRRARSSGASATSAPASATRSRPGSCACRSCAPPGTSSSTRSGTRSPTSPRCACARRSRRRAAARGRHAVVHDGLRPRHDHHVPADAALRARARAHGAGGARRAAVHGGRPDDRRRAGEDRPRGARTARRRRTGSRATTAPSTRRRSTSSCCPRSGGGPTTRPSCAS